MKRCAAFRLSLVATIFLQVIMVWDVCAQDAPSGYTPMRAPINARTPVMRYQGNAPAGDTLPSGIRPYQVSPEFPINSPAVNVGVGQSGNISQGYVPSVGGGELGQQGVTTPAMVTPEPEEVKLEPENTKKAVLRFTDKIAARSTEMTIAVPSQVSYQTLVMQVEKCQIAAQERNPEHAMLLEIFASEDVQGNPSNARVFGGWMFKQKSSLTSLQHPFYDVTLVQCVSDPSTKPKPKIEVKKPEDIKKPDEVAKPVQVVPQTSTAVPPATSDITTVPAVQPALSPPPVENQIKAIETTPSTVPNAAVNPLNEPIYQDATVPDTKAAEDAANRAVDAVTRTLGEDTPVTSGAALPEGQTSPRMPINQDVMAVPSAVIPHSQGVDAAYPSSD